MYTFRIGQVRSGHKPQNAKDTGKGALIRLRGSASSCTVFGWVESGSRDEDEKKTESDREHVQSGLNREVE